MMLSLLAALSIRMYAQEVVPPSLAEENQNTNDLSANIAELQKLLAPSDPGFIFAKPIEPAARLAIAERMTQAANLREEIPAEIELLAEGAIGRFGPHQVTFPPAMPALISLRTPAGVILNSHVLALCYISDKGNSVVLAEIKPSGGELIGADTIVYRDGFSGVSADIVYEYKRSSFEQLVVIRKELPPPSQFGFSESESVSLAVVTEFVSPPQPRRSLNPINLAEHYSILGLQKNETLFDETLSWGAMRMIEGRSFTLGQPERSVPAGKSWQVLTNEDGQVRHLLIESTPYNLIKAQLDALPGEGAYMPSGKTATNLQTALLDPKTAQPLDGSEWLMARSSVPLDAEPGVLLDYLIVNTALLNVEFCYTGKYGPAAFGYDSWDYWNVYSFEGYEVGALTDLYWSDNNQSSVGIVVSNAPGAACNPLCVPVDYMYAYFVHPTNGGLISVTITNLPSDDYDIVVYATRASEAGAPLFELKRDTATLWHKGTTSWGAGWHSPVWEEHEQFVRFRNIAITNQTLTLVAWQDAAGYASLSGLQIIPASAIPAYEPEILKLLNVNFGGASTDKTGFAAVGLATNDFWNHYAQGGAYVGSVPNLKWSNTSNSSAGLLIRNSPGSWGVPSLPDPMFRSYLYSWNAGNITVTITNLPEGNCDFYLYGHSAVVTDNAIYELWTDEVNQGIKGTSLKGYGHTSNRWEIGQQYVLFKDVAILSNKPVVFQAKHSVLGYNNLSGFQLVYKGDIDSDEDGLPDAWELKWFGNLDQAGDGDYDADGLSNLREYQLSLNPGNYDSDSDGIADWQDNEFPIMEDATAQGGYQYTGGGETWNWVTSWSDGTGWEGGTLYPHSGQQMRVTVNTTNTMHQHYFERAVAVMRPATGDVLYAYVNLDPTKPPAEIMLQFQILENNGYYGREHRAYWGANNLAYGTDGTVSRTNMGALPQTGQWVRLEVPAHAVGLEGKIVEGINFTLYSGRAAWDSAGLLRPDMDGDGVVDIDADGLPDWWELEHFGNLSQPSDGDFDDDGISNLDEYSTASDPNSISFYTLFQSLRVNGETAPGAVTTLAGHPSYIALLVDSTNVQTAAWSSFLSTNFTANIGSAEAQHSVMIGLKGRATNSEPTWNSYWITRDTTVPLIVLTNPASEVVFQPVLQLRGYSPEPLLAIRFNVTNSSGVLTNLPGYVTSQFVNTNTLEITTNWFACTHAPLAPGTNHIALIAFDWAGNVSTNEWDIVFVYPTNAPALSIVWPQDGEMLSGTNFALRGRISDPTASVTAEVIGDGVTNMASAVIERDGKFWIENLPLAEGSNVINLLAVDTGTNSVRTNLVVTKSSLALAIEPLEESTLNQPFITVYGTINVSDHKVWVNGVEVTNVVGGGWSVEGVPVNEGGTAVIQARAIPLTDNGGNGDGGGSGGEEATYDHPGNPASFQSTTTEREKDKPARVVAVQYHKSYSWLSIERSSSADAQIREDIIWERDKPGSWWEDDCHSNAGLEEDDYYFLWSKWDWNEKGQGDYGYGASRGSKGTTCGVYPYYYTYPASVSDAWPGEFCRIAAYRLYHPSPTAAFYDEVVARSARTLYELRTGGKATFAPAASLFVLSASAEGMGDPFWWEREQNKKAYSILSDKIVLGSLGPLGNDGKLYRALPNEKAFDVTPTVEGNPYYTYTKPSPSKHWLRIIANGQDCQNPLFFERPKFIVGQYVDLQSNWQNGTPDGIVDYFTENTWSLGGNFYNDGTNAVPGSSFPDCSTNYFKNDILLKNDPTTVWWVSGQYIIPAAYDVSLKKELTFQNGQQATLEEIGTIQMYRPNATITPSITQVMVYNDGLWQLGLMDPAFLEHGITLTNSISIPVGFSGTNDWVQVVDSSRSLIDENSGGHTLLFAGLPPYRDTYPWTSFLIDEHPIDDPSQQLESEHLRYEVSDSYRMWMMFKPNLPGVWVPLRAVNWGWNGIVTNGPSGWVLQTSPNSCYVDSVEDTEEYPTWKSQIQNCFWAPPL